MYITAQKIVSISRLYLSLWGRHKSRGPNHFAEAYLVLNSCGAIIINNSSHKMSSHYDDVTVF